MLPYRLRPKLDANTHEENSCENGIIVSGIHSQLRWHIIYSNQEGQLKLDRSLWEGVREVGKLMGILLCHEAVWD